MALGLINLLITYTLLTSNGIDYINAGEAKLNDGKFEEAIVLFNQAINSNLSYIGSAICYWNIFIAYDKLNQDDSAAEALMAFRNTILLFEDELKSYKSNHPGFALMLRYKIRNKIKYANTMLDIYWMKKTTYNCRTILFSCDIPNIKYIAIYNDKLPLCNKSKIDNIEVQTIDKNLEINVSCRNATTERYYFRVRDGL